MAIIACYVVNDPVYHRRWYYICYNLLYFTFDVALNAVAYYDNMYTHLAQYCGAV